MASALTSLSSAYQVRVSNKQGEVFLPIAKISLGHLGNNGARVMNIGSGPLPGTSRFVETLLPYCKEIVLVEPCDAYCNEYEKQAWFRDEQCKVSVVRGTFEDVMASGDFEKGYFNLVWGSHILYYWRLDQIPGLVKYIFELLVIPGGVAVLINSSLNSSVDLMKKRLCTHYRHVDVFNAFLDHNVRHFVRLAAQEYRSTPNIEDQLRYYLDSNVLGVADYRSQDTLLTAEELREREAVLAEFVAKAIPCEDGHYTNSCSDCNLIVRTGASMM